MLSGDCNVSTLIALLCSSYSMHFAKYNLNLVDFVKRLRDSKLLNIDISLNAYRFTANAAIAMSYHREISQGKMCE